MTYCQHSIVLRVSSIIRDLTAGILLNMTHKDEWFRSAGWSQADQDLFNEKIARAQGNARRQQYARIKALALIETKDLAKNQAAVDLLQRALREWPDDPLWESGTHALLGDAFCVLKKYEAASGAYNTSITWDKRFYHQGYWNYPLMVIEEQFSGQYDQALSIVDRYVAENDLVFPSQKFIYRAVRAIVFEAQGEHAEAKDEATEALVHAATDSSAFTNHPTTGLVDTKKNAALIERLQSILL